MALAPFADRLTRQVEGMAGRVTGGFFEPTIRLGVTGLARAGKTVFITALVANLIDRGRMGQLGAAAEGRILAAYLQPQPDDTLPRFDYEDHLAAMTGDDPHWPDNTRAVSELRLSLRVQPKGLLGGLSGPRVVHVDIVDYPGEWLLDLALLDKSYDDWAAETLARAESRDEGAAMLAAMRAANGAEKFEEADARRLAETFTDYLRAARAAGWANCSPGRFLLPGDLAGSPVLTFAPLPPAEGAGRRALRAEMARRFEAYKAQVVRPFFRDHFARIDRQVVLCDVLDAIHQGPAALEDLRGTMADILTAFRPGSNDFLRTIFLGRRVERILFAATKADHLHHTQHERLTRITRALMREAESRAEFSGAKTKALSLASLRATTEEMRAHEGSELPCVRGRLEEGGRSAAFYPGELPEDPQRLPNPARAGGRDWLDAEFARMRFLPQTVALKPGEGPPHIRLDRAAEFLLGDRL